MNVDFSQMNIEQSKMFADAKKYFEMFDKYIVGNYKACLIYDICNSDVIAEIMRKNTDCKYFIYDDAMINEFMMHGMHDFNKFDIKCFDSHKIDNDTFWKNVAMKFDKIIMNPPYCKNLHLKILAEAIEHLSEDGKCVNLSPVRWLQDPLAKYKKNSDFKRFEESVSKHIENLDIFSANEISELFNIQSKSDHGIYFLNTKENRFDFSNIKISSGKSISFVQDLYEKLNEKTKDTVLKHIVEYKNRTTENFVIVSLIGGCSQRGNEYQTHSILKSDSYGPFVNSKFNGKTLLEAKAANKRSTCGIVENWFTVCFDSGNESVNFYNSLKTKFQEYLAWAFSCDQNVPNWAIPFMGEEINPRTGLKGYESEWTDEDLYKFFNITEEEQKIIEETMEKYK